MDHKTTPSDFSPLSREKNRIPANVSSIHFIAVCGTAMGALAAACKEMGYRVSGSDAGIYPPMSLFLEEKGISLFEGYDPQHLEISPDLVVVGNAVRRDNPEVLSLAEKGLFFCSMPQAINHFLVAGKRTLVVAGTHGKTTTSSLAAVIFDAAGFSPSFLIGGILKDFGANYRVANGGWVILEGDEYDTAFFDKGAKFFHYVPGIAILTSIEFDHADIFKDIEEVKASFEKFVSMMGKDHILIAHDSDENIDQVLSRAKCRILRYGRKPGSYWRITDESDRAFSVYRGKDFFGRFEFPLMGAHNRENALAAIAAAAEAGAAPEKIRAGVAGFSGVKRRQEIRGEKSGVVVIDDFAHHPTAVRETIRAVRERYKNRRILAVFEPRTNTSMRNIFQNRYPGSFTGADIVYVRKPPLLSKVPAGMHFSSQRLVGDLLSMGIDARYFEDTDGIIEDISRTARAGDIILVMSNGGFDNIHERLLKIL